MAVNRDVARAIGDVFDVVIDNWMLFTVLATAGYLFGPSLLVYLDRTNRLPRGLIWTYSAVFVPVIVLLMATVGASPGYCNDPLPHDVFRIFYLLILPILPLYVHYVRGETCNIPSTTVSSSPSSRSGFTASPSPTRCSISPTNRCKATG